MRAEKEKRLRKKGKERSPKKRYGKRLMRWGLVTNEDKEGLLLPSALCPLPCNELQRTKRVRL